MSEPDFETLAASGMLPALYALTKGPRSGYLNP